MILFDHIIQVLDLPNNDVGAVFLIVAPDGRGISFTAVDRDRLRYPMAADGLGQEAYGRPLVPLFGQEERVFSK